MSNRRPPPPPPLPPPPPPPSGSGRSVQATSGDADPDALKLLLSRTTVLAGTVKVTFNNAFAQDPHNLVLEGPGEAVVFDELPPGDVAVRSAPLAAGTWTVYCALEGHEARGMRARLTVAAG
jgi:plastocyanin